MTKIISASRLSFLSLGFLSALVTFSLAGALSANAATLLTGEASIGSTGSNVTTLQQFLAADPSIYPQGEVTGYFGSLTAAAVSQFQVAFGLPQVGKVGPLTLTKINSIITSGLPLNTNAPIISTIWVSPASVTASVGWTTDEVTSGQVYYDTNPIVAAEATAPFQLPYISGTLAVDTNSSRQAHTVTLSNLQPNTTYYYVIRSVDASGNVSMTLANSFHTTN